MPARVALALVAAACLSGCLAGAAAQEPAVSAPGTDAWSDVDAGTAPAATAPRFPTATELAAARALRVIYGHTARLPVQSRHCPNGHIAAPRVECATADQASASLDPEGAQPPTPPDACPAYFVALEGGRSRSEATPYPGLFDAAATRRARRREPTTCCYRIEGRCPDSRARWAQ